MPTPSLTPLPPADGAALGLLDAVAVTIGSAPGADVHVELPGVAPHHAVIESRDGGWWIRPVDGMVELNGVRVTDATRLRDRDQVRIATNVYYEFATGEKRTRRMSSVADMVARPRKRSYGRMPGPSWNISFAALGTVVLAILCVAGAAGVLWYGFVRAPKTVGALDDRQSAELDALLVLAYDHVERGGTLLELGLGDGALDEFARAVNTLELSDLRNHPQVKPRIEALEASVAAIYRERSLAVPSNYANATSPLTPDQLKTASLSVDQFAANFALMSAAFDAKFGHEIVVSGRDHAEHVILYGKGGAMDLSIKNMNPVEVRFVIDQSHARHIRVKDFSQDTILRRQVANAIKAGLLFEAGTGLHLHIDRFANRRDRWTTLRIAPLPERPREFIERRAPAGILASRSRDGV
jgi:FHA domain